MLNKNRGLAFILFALTVFIIAGCGGGEMEAEVVEERTVLEGKGIYTGQIDSQSVEIVMAGEPRAFALGDGVDLSGVPDGSEVAITYIEEDERPLLKSIEALGVEEDEILQGEGTYVGQIDLNSVEIEVNGEPAAYAIGEGLSVENIEDGSKIKFTYSEGEARPVLKSVEVIEAPEKDETDMVLTGEGTLIGLIDSRSVEIEIYRAFMLHENVNVEDIEDGSLVAFTYTETGQRAVIEWIKSVDEYMEGEVMHGTLVGQIDSQSVEIRYVQAFTIGNDINIEKFDEGTEVIFTYSVDPHRPLLETLTER